MSMKEEMQFIPPCDGYQPFVLILCGYSYCDTNYVIRRPRSNLTCVEYILDGTGTVHANGQVYHPEKGDFYMLHQGDDQYYYADRDRPWTKVWFNITGELVTKLVSEYGLRNMNYVRGLNLLPLFEQMVALTKRAAASEDIYDEALLIFIRILQRVSRSLRSSRETISPDALHLKEYIHRNIRRNISTQELAQVIYRSESQATRIFKKAFSVTPCEYILRLKMETARQLLLNTNLRIIDISARLGFTDEHYFSKCFKRKTGFSPREYREVSRHPLQNATLP